MENTITVSKFVDVSTQYPLIDVRTPQEFKLGHIPGAHNVPVLSDEGGELVQTAYDQQGKEAAMLLGLDLCSRRMRPLIEQIKLIAHNKKTNTFLVYGAYNGLRSKSLSLLMRLFDYEVSTLADGYQAFRNYTHTIVREQKKMIILGGSTGSGKTHILRALKEHGEQIIDLELLAQHRGSIFGSLGQKNQPTQEQFENELTLAWRSIDPEKTVWIEDEDRYIGRLSIPEMFWNSMREAPVMYIKVPEKQRISNLCREYGAYSLDALIPCVTRLTQRIGGMITQEIITALQASDTQTACTLLLAYYDKMYQQGLMRRSPESVVYCMLQDTDYPSQARELQQLCTSQLGLLTDLKSPLPIKFPQAGSSSQELTNL